MNRSLRLTSKRQEQENSDAGKYVGIGKDFFNPPIGEQYHVEEVEGKSAQSRAYGVNFFSAFFKIDYCTQHNNIVNVEDRL